MPTPPPEAARAVTSPNGHCGWCRADQPAPTPPSRPPRSNRAVDPSQPNHSTPGGMPRARQVFLRQVPPRALPQLRLPAARCPQHPAHRSCGRAGCGRGCSSGSGRYAARRPAGLCCQAGLRCPAQGSVQRSGRGWGSCSSYPYPRLTRANARAHAKNLWITPLAQRERGHPQAHF